MKIRDETVSLANEVILIGSGNSTKIMGYLYLYGNTSIIGCYVDQGVYIRGNDIKIVNCDMDSLYIYVNSYRCHIENSIFRKGFQSGGSTMYQSTIIRCDIYGEVRNMDDSVLIGNKILIEASKYLIIFGNSLLSNNFIRYIGEEEFNWQSFDSVSTMTVEHNTIVADFDRPTPNTLWRNNIIFTTETAAIDASGNLTGNPFFVDAANDDYHLATGSPAINSGAGLDADKSVADIGMYGGVRSGIWNPITETAGHPVVGHVIVTPNPIAPGEPLRLRFTARSTP